MFSLRDDTHTKIRALSARRDMTLSDLITALVEAEWEREGGVRCSNRS